MDVTPLHEGQVAGLYTLYGAVTARAPHCRFVPSLERFAAALTTPSRPNTRLFVAEEAGTVRGFAALLPLDPDDQTGKTRASITALFVSDEQAGQPLLDACIDMARSDKVELLEAFGAEHGRCPVPGYNAGWDALSDTLPEVARLLARNGFSPTYRELLLTCDLRRFASVVETAPAGVTVERRVPESGGWKLVPFLDGQSAGICEYGTLTSIVDDPDAGRVGYVWGIGIAEWARRRGIARHLMELTLAHLHEIGCDACWLSTGADNWPAQPLYLSLGFEVVDATVSFRRVLA